ncbi:MAG TPA: ATP-binding protein [Clostridia bacterium]|nr:ATP-binding protein [Clostridia bacterium]
MPADLKGRPTESRPRRLTLVLLALGIFLLFGIIFSQAAFNLTFLKPDTLAQTLVFAAMSALIFLLLVALTFVLIRTLLKLYLERQTGVLGSKFRTKMVLGALVLSFAPVIAMFLFSYGLMNRSIDKWFSRPVEEVREHTSTVTSLLSGYAGQNALAEADAIAASAEAQKAFRTRNFDGVLEEFRRRGITLQGGFALAIFENRAEASFQAPDAWYVLAPKLPLAGLSNGPRIFSLNGHEYMLASASVGRDGLILVAMPLSAKYSDALRELRESEQKYNALRSERKLIRQTYMQLLMLLTVLVLFAATWFALYLSKMVTRPVSALALATQEISSGRLDYRVEVAAGDELAELVGSFNRMAAELESNRRQIEASSRDLSHANVELEERRRQLETVLESIPTGVLSLDAVGRVTRANDALVRMFHPQGLTDVRYAAGASLRDFFPGEMSQDLDRMLRKADRMGTTTAQMEVTVEGRQMVVAVTAASIDARLRVPRPANQRLGYVIILEDLSDLLKAQKQAAWREVARRIAHEIKNPLTPITLSAERIRRHLARGAPDDQSLAVIHGCAETIAGAVETVRALVDEFSTLARFPASQPQPADLNAIVESALSLFDGRLDGIAVHRFLSPDLPHVMADSEAIKRVIANLVDNAAEALKECMVREIEISTSLLGSRDAVELVIADTGQGVTAEVKERLFLPYFSTKQRGTGLGLAIVSRIIEDHQGTIRVEENKPVGARFIVELPVAAELGDREPGASTASNLRVQQP